MRGCYDALAPADADWDEGLDELERTLARLPPPLAVVRSSA